MRLTPFLLPVLALPLAGCVPMMAANAVGAAAGAARRPAQSNAGLRPEAIAACSARAAAYGTVRIIDTEQRSIDKIVVWGTADDGTQKRSFECSFGRAVTGFRLRAIPKKAG